MRRFLACAFLLFLGSCHHAERVPSNDAASSIGGDTLKGVHRGHHGKPALDAAFQDPEGKTVKLQELKGTPILVNLWATWCAPCVKELPTLDKLQRTGAVSVVAVSEDTGPHASVVAFLKEHQITSLKAYQDPNMRLSSGLGADAVLPTSILVDADGKEVWRYVGELDWTSPEASKLLAESGARAKKG